jgi:hypothetical protein
VREVRHPRNAPGPFFCNDDLCVSCGAPLRHAPTLIAVDEASGQCYFKRQPQTPEETEQACCAMEASCVGGVGYEGQDPAILARLEKELSARRRFLQQLARLRGRWSRVLFRRRRRTS